MTKYDEELRRRIVDRYLSGAGGTEMLAKEYGVGRSTLRQWIAAYQVHGQQGLRKKHSAYSARFKLQVLEHMWRNDLSYGQVSAVFDLRESNGVGRWERQYHEGGYDALKPRPKGRPPKMPHTKPTPAAEPALPVDKRSIEDVLKENEYLRAEVAYLKKLEELQRQKAQAAKLAKQRKS